PSCVTLAAQVGGCTLTTVESLGSARKLHPLQEAFIDTGAIQCGFCTPGMVLSAHALLKRNPNPTEDEIRDALSGNLCRCTGYVKWRNSNAPGHPCFHRSECCWQSRTQGGCCETSYRKASFC